MAADSGHPEHTPHSAVSLAWQLRQAWEFDAARAMFQVAIDSGHPDHAPDATVTLGTLLGDPGDVEGGIAAFRRAPAGR